MTKKFKQEEILEMLQATLDSMVDIVGEGDKLVNETQYLKSKEKDVEREKKKRN